MLVSEDMLKLRFFIPKRYLKASLDELYKAKAIHLIKENNDKIDMGSPLDNSSVISDALIKARSIIYQLGIKNLKKDSIQKYNTQGTSKKEAVKKSKIQSNIYLVKNIFDIVSKITTRNNEIKARLKYLKESRQILAGIKKLNISLGLYRETEHLNFKVGYIDNSSNLLRKLRGMKEDNYLLHTTQYQKKGIISIFYDKKLELSILRALSDSHFNEIKIPQEFIGKKNPLKTLEKEAASLDAEKKSLEKDLNKIKYEKAGLIIYLEHILSEASKKSEAPLMFGETANIIMITGWVPRKQAGRLIFNLEKITSKKMYFERLNIKKGENVPVKLNNPKFAKPYEFLLRLFSVPSYKEINPSIFMFFTFPLFFGFMLGDVGYGFLTLIIFLIAKKMLKSMKDLINILIFSSIASIIFGLVFGEFFGYELSEVYIFHQLFNNIQLHYPIIHRGAETVGQLLIITLLIGTLHINFGLMLGFINVYKQHGIRHALFEKASWFLLELGAIALALGFSSRINMSPLFGSLMIVGAVIFIYMGEGIRGIVELPSIFVHIGSYMRLMAIGLASVGLAGVINEQSASLLAKGPLWAIFAVFIFTIGHMINLLLGIIGPFLHSLRLHYVENFTKFYAGGGTEFDPFGKTGEDFG